MKTSRAQERREGGDESALGEGLAEAKRCVEAVDLARAAVPHNGSQHVDVTGDSQKNPAYDPAHDVALMFGQLQETLKEEAGWRGWLRSRSSRVRLMWVVGLVGVLVVGVLWWGRRDDWGGYPGERLMLVVGCFGVGIGATVWGVMRWPYRPERGVREWLWGVVGGIGVPLMLVGLSAAGVGGQAYWEGAPSALRCLVGGAVLVSPLLLLLGLLMRDLSGVRLVLMAASGGLVGNLLLELHCAVGEVPHLMLGHVMLSILLVGASLGWSVWGRRVRGV